MSKHAQGAIVEGDEGKVRESNSGEEVGRGIWASVKGLI